ncbi:hypothetical protein M409DRAFT_58730 [Zasmidium cellare ATCC 36951]|uniref:GATA-type domain-containing protein n=1 Tax=Zasmidium cellare ATCC 36951 TaxID=1080233 RepID=A0A6A6C4J9_ZASCE|nr:uncharacterized protein M409DRAFT_58730 [Zasmidium cellare ATCC 36951]KAF2161961.1 hypothetical protein M409DRAFT_58730 [Zasmidium cellare ATCC 36951]
MDRRNERDESSGEESEVDDLRQLELDRNHNDQKLKSRFEHIFRKYEHDFEGIGDEIEIDSGDIVVDNGHLQHMRHEADPGKSASSRFVKTFQEKLGYEDENSSEEDEEDEDDDGTEDDEDEESVSDERSETPAYRHSPAHAASHQRQRRLSPRKAMRAFGDLARPAPRLAHLLVGEGTPQPAMATAASLENQDDSSIESISGTSTPTNVLSKVPGLQESIHALQPRAKRSDVGPEAIEALGVSIANQLAQLMAGPSKSKRKEARAKERKAAKQSVWDYPELAPRPRKKRRRSPSPIALPLPSSPAPGSPGEESLWAPEGSVRPSKRSRREQEQPQARPAVTRSKRLQLPSSGAGTSRKEVRRCWNCSLTSTPGWQKGPHGQDLCESCARYYLHNRRMKPFDSPTPSADEQDEETREYRDVRNTQEHSRSRRRQATPPVEVVPVPNTTRVQTDGNADEHDNVRGTQILEPAGSYFYRPIPTNVPDPDPNVQHHSGPSTAQSRMATDDAHRQQHQPENTSSRYPQRISNSPIASETSDRDSGQDESEEEPPNDDSRSRQSDRHLRNSRATLHEQYEGTQDHEWARDHVIDVAREETAQFRAVPQHQAQSADRAVTLAAEGSQTGVQSEGGYLANTSRTLITSPSRKKGYFSIEEDILIIRLKEQEKLTWDEITPYFPHRSPYAVSGRYTRELKFGRNPARDWLEAQAEANPNDEGPDPVLREDLAWNENQDELLLELREDQELEWHEIASLLPGHSPEAVEERYELLAQRGMEQHQQKYNLPTLKSEDYADAEEKVANWMLYFSPEEDALIVRLREVEGLQWSEIGKQLRSRPLASIQRRYSRSLAPQVRKVTPTSKHDVVKGSMEDRLLAVDPRLSGIAGAALYSPEEDRLIKTMKDDYWLSWEVIAQRLPGRTADAARHRYEYKYGAEAEAARQEAERLATIAARQSKYSQPAPYPGMGVIEFNAPPSVPPPAASTAVPIRASGHKVIRPRSTAPRIPPLHPSRQQSFNNMAVVSESLDTTAVLPKSPQKKSKAGPGSRTPFTEDEDDAILQLREMRGLSWEDIAMQLPGRSVNSISSRYADTIRPARAVTSRVVLDPTTTANSSQLPARPVQQTAAASTPTQPNAQQPASSQRPQHMFPVSASSGRQEQGKNKSGPPRKSLPSTLPSASRSQNPLLRKALDNSLRRRSDMGSAAMSFDQNGNPSKTTSSRDSETPSQQLLQEMASSLQTPSPTDRTRATAAPPAAQDESSSESSEVGDDQMYQNLMHAATKFAIQQKNPALFSRVKEIFEKNPDDDRLHQLLGLASTSSASTSDMLSAFEHIVDPSPAGRGEKRLLQSRATQSQSGEAAPASQQPPATSQRLPVRTPTRPPASQLNGSDFTSAATSVAGRHKTTTAARLEEANAVQHGEQRQDTRSQQPNSTRRPRRAAFNDASRRNAELFALPVENNGETSATRVETSNAPSSSRSRAIDTDMFTDQEPSASPKNDQGALVFVPEGKKVRGRPRRSDLDWSPHESILKVFKTDHRDFMPLKDIYAAVEADHVPDGNWKLAVRTALNKKPSFERVVDEGRSGWRLVHEGEVTQDGNRGGPSVSFSQESAPASRPSRRNVRFNSNGDDPYVPEDNESSFVTDADETIVVNVAPKQRRIMSNINARDANDTSADDGTIDELSSPAKSSGQLSSPGQQTSRRETPMKSILKNGGTSRKETPRVIEIANSDDEDELSPSASLHEVDELDLLTSPPSRRGSLNVLPTSDINRDPLSSDAAEPVVKSSSSKRTRDPKAAAVPSSSPLFMKPRTPASALPKKLVTPRPSTSRLSQLMKETPVRAQSPIFMSRSASVASARRSSLGKRVVETPVREVDSDEDELA